MVLDLGEEEENIFEHSKEFDQGLGNIRKGAVTYIVAKDGSGDFGTIKEALKAIPSTGGKIQVKEGTYIENTITIPYSNISIEGISPGTPTISLGNNNGILINGKNKVIIVNLNFTGGSTVGKYAIAINNSYDCLIKENYTGQMVGCQLTGGSSEIKSSIIFFILATTNY